MTLDEAEYAAARLSDALCGEPEEVRITLADLPGVIGGIVMMLVVVVLWGVTT